MKKREETRTGADRKGERIHFENDQEKRGETKVGTN